MANAFKHGATVEELLETLELCVPIGIQSVMAGLPILDEELEILGRELGSRA
jgi:alkylhydroperoxidase/carboxymuconolactone decarboxylase family protein YurZ